MQTSHLIYVPHSHHIGGALARRRRELGLSRALLAQKCGVHPHTIARHEKGISKCIDQALLERLARALETTPEALWEAASSQPPITQRVGRPKNKEHA